MTREKKAPNLARISMDREGKLAKFIIFNVRKCFIQSGKFEILTKISELQESEIES